MRLEAEKITITVPRAVFWWDCELSMTAPTRTTIPVIMANIAETPKNPPVTLMLTARKVVERILELVP